MLIEDQVRTYGDKQPRRRRGKNREIVRPGDYVFGTCRMLHRRYLLRPDAEMVNDLKWIFGHYAQKHGVRILALCVMSTHFHIVLQDVRGKNPNFFRDVNRSIANVVKAKFGYRSKVFEPVPNKVVLHGPLAVADKIGYTLANPKAAAAVCYPHEWPGLRTRISDMGRCRVVARRPRHYFGRRKRMAETATFEVAQAECLVEAFGDERARAELNQAYERHLERARVAVAEKGWKYMGAERAKKMNPFECATSYEAFETRVPRLSTFGLSAEEAKQIKRDYVAWQTAYEECRSRLLRGESDIEWPYGTWAMVQFFGQRSVDPLPQAA